MAKRSRAVNPKKLEELRLAKGWSHEQLATKTGLSKRTIERLEKGEPAFFDTIHKVAQKLGVESQTLCDVAAAPLLDRQPIIVQHTKEYMTVEEASQSLGMEKAKFIDSAIEHSIWIGIILGRHKMRFFRGEKLLPFLTRLDDTINTERLRPLYVEYPDSALEYMPVYDDIFLSHDISINNIRIPCKELDYIPL